MKELKAATIHRLEWNHQPRKWETKCHQVIGRSSLVVPYFISLILNKTRPSHHLGLSKNLQSLLTFRHLSILIWMDLCSHISTQNLNWKNMIISLSKIPITNISTAPETSSAHLRNQFSERQSKSAKIHLYACVINLKQVWVRRLFQWTRKATSSRIHHLKCINKNIK